MQTTQRVKTLCDFMHQWVRTSGQKNHTTNHIDVCKFAFDSYRNKISWQFRQFHVRLGEKLDVFGNLVSKQCNAIAAQRLRRSMQIFNLYSKIYTERSLRTIIDNFKRTVMKHRKMETKPLLILLGASIFSWERDQITDYELDGCIEDAENVRDLLKATGKLGSSEAVTQTETVTRMDLTPGYMDQWENVIDRCHLQVWRRPLDNSYLCEYKVCGSYNDIPARAFYNVQMNLDYRKEWDRLVIALDVIDTDETTGSNVIHWITHFPYPMYSRDYVYVRRCRWDTDHNTMVLSCRAVEHPTRPTNEKYVRVSEYTSNMVITPHTSFDENGFDYVLTYHDDPQAGFPTFAFRWMATTGLPDFVDKLHRAAKALNERTTKPRRPCTESVRVAPTPKQTHEKITPLSGFS